MEVMQIAELGAQISLDAILLWLVMKYLPNRDAMLVSELKSQTDAINRLVTLWVGEIKKTGINSHPVEMRDRVIKGEKRD